LLKQRPSSGELSFDCGVQSTACPSVRKRRAPSCLSAALSFSRP
jgi:hypothetical protein